MSAMLVWRFQGGEDATQISADWMLRVAEHERTCKIFIFWGHKQCETLKWEISSVISGKYTKM